MMNVLRVAGALLLATALTQPCFAKYLDEDMSQFHAPSRTVAMVQPSYVTPAITMSSSPRDPALYELGVGMGGAFDPDYPGSDQSRVTVLPFPFGVYRGQILRSDAEGTRAKLFRTERFDLSLSGTGSLPVRSANSFARSGMEDLGWMAQIGPKVRFAAKDWADGSTLRLGISARAAYSLLSGSDLTARGFTFQPEIVYEKPSVFFERLDFFSSLSATFATANYMDYLYGVRPADATASRAAFAARGGYIESELQAGLSYRTVDGRHKLVLNVQGGSLRGSVNEDSPLVRSKLDLMVGAAWIWTLFESEEKAVGVD